MNLRKASQAYAGKRAHYNPLWVYIYTPFTDYLLKQRLAPDDPLYVSQRIAPGGVSVEDVLEHARRNPGKLLMIVGPPGVGKTTFLRRALASVRPSDPFVVIAVDVLHQSDPIDSRTPAQQVRELIQQEVGKALASRIPDVTRWHRFFLERLGNPDGLAGILLEELRRSGTLSADNRGRLGDSIQVAMRDRLLDYTRALCAFLQSELNVTPVIVIDNVDQLVTKQIDEIRAFADVLARGIETDQRPNERAAVIMAARPIYLQESALRTHYVDVGHLEAPVLADVLWRRVEAFLESFEGRLAPGPVLKDGDGRSADLREVFPGFDLPPSALVKEALLQVLKATTTETTLYGSDLVALLQQLNNFNTRQCLLAATQYIASGHLDWVGILDVLANRRRPVEVFSPRKTMMALILGVRSIFDTHSSWLCNVFSDSQSDATGVVIRLRILRGVSGAIVAPRGVPRDEFAYALSACFDYPVERVDKVLSNLLELGLLEERMEGRLELSKSGEAYLHHMMNDFEYLQHVVIDSYVSPEYLTNCTKHDEPAHLRFLRVVRFGRWIQDIETQELSTVLVNGQQNLYGQIFGRELLSAEIARTLRHVDWLPRPERDRDAWESADSELTDLIATAKYDFVLNEARLHADSKTRDAATRTATS